MLKIVALIAFAAICSRLIGATSDDCSDSSCLDKLLDPSDDYDAMKKAYNKVNDYLIEKFPNDIDPEKNLYLAIEWLKTKPKKLFSRNAHLVVLDNLKELKTLKGDTDCGSKSLKIMKKNNEGTRLQANRRRAWLEAPRRIDLIVRHYSDEHAKSCLKIYPTKFSNNYKEFVSNEHVKLVEEFVRGHIYGKMKYVRNRSRDFRWTLGDLETIKHPDWRKDLPYLMSGKYFNVTELYDFIELVGKNDPDIKFMQPAIDEKKGKMTVREDKVGAMVEKYFIDPCNYYTKEFGPEIFEPALYDATMEDEELNYLDKDYIASQFDFYFGLECFQICSSLSYRRKIVLKEMTKIALDPKNRYGIDY